MLYIAKQTFLPTGDVTADVGLVNVGEMEARHAVEVICLEYAIITSFKRHN